MQPLPDSNQGFPNGIRTGVRKTFVQIPAGLNCVYHLIQLSVLSLEMKLAERSNREFVINPHKSKLRLHQRDLFFCLHFCKRMRTGLNFGSVYVYAKLSTLRRCTLWLLWFWLSFYSKVRPGLQIHKFLPTKHHASENGVVWVSFPALNAPSVSLSWSLRSMRRFPVKVFSWLIIVILYITSPVHPLGFHCQGVHIWSWETCNSNRTSFSKKKKKKKEHFCLLQPFNVYLYWV